MVMGEGATAGEPMAPVLVYGTLKRGFANHPWLQGAPYLGEGVMEGLALHDLGPFPMAVPSAGGARLQGELYGVDGVLLTRLDRLEGTPRLYQRRRHPLLGGGEAWVYVGRPAQVRHSPRLASGRWDGPAKGRPSRPETPLA
jgi:gamma-glutamylcyclotransferase (GGCT)/AIG2-like uncharacterized protein YtfP